jgi:hypothetical protein
MTLIIRNLSKRHPNMILIMVICLQRSEWWERLGSPKQWISFDLHVWFPAQQLWQLRSFHSTNLWHQRRRRDQWILLNSMFRWERLPGTKLSPLSFRNWRPDKFWPSLSESNSRNMKKHANGSCIICRNSICINMLQVDGIWWHVTNFKVPSLVHPSSRSCRSRISSHVKDAFLIKKDARGSLDCSVP